MGNNWAGLPPVENSSADLLRNLLYRIQAFGSSRQVVMSSVLMLLVVFLVIGPLRILDAGILDKDPFLRVSLDVGEGGLLEDSET
jgi:hypothetical protein